MLTSQLAHKIRRMIAKRRMGQQGTLENVYKNGIHSAIHQQKLNKITDLALNI